MPILVSGKVGKSGKSGKADQTLWATFLIEPLFCHSTVKVKE